eukprot:TRINITY_DN10726_c0_g1_i1.p1 TRINITY_DN10726_c0_g1~~TRINITY_DN10726_c0_g1_i1.p1  ORF type:complete len:300 (+),score=51.74 TRINITY_DN10726_c0_g1_i1:43-942(+)
MSRVCMLGLGKMGGAMARRLGEKGHKVVLWNRTKAKADAIAEEFPNCVAKETVADAVAADKEALIVMVMTTMEATSEILESVKSDLSGRVVVNLASGNPDQGRNIAKQLSEYKIGGYLDGAYSGPPAKARAGAGTLFLSAAEKSLFDTHTSLLSDLGENIWSGDIGASRALDYAVVDLVLANMMCYSSALSMMEKEGVDQKTFFECSAKRLSTVPAMLELSYERMKDRTEEGYSTNPVATLGTWRNFVSSRLPYMSENQMSTVIPEFNVSVIDKAIEKGGSPDDDITRIQEVTRYSKPQ